MFLFFLDFIFIFSFLLVYPKYSFLVSLIYIGNKTHQGMLLSENNKLSKTAHQTFFLIRFL